MRYAVKMCHLRFLLLHMRTRGSLIIQHRMNIQEDTQCALLAPGHANNMELSFVAYGSAQATTSATAGPLHYSIGIDSVVEGFEDIPLPVPIEEVEITKLWQAICSFVEWPRAWVKLINKEPPPPMPRQRRPWLVLLALLRPPQRLPGNLDLRSRCRDCSGIRITQP